MAASACEHQGATVVSPPTKHVAVVHPPVHVPTRLVPNPESIVPLPQLIAILVELDEFAPLHVSAILVVLPLPCEDAPIANEEHEA